VSENTATTSSNKPVVDEPRQEPGLLGTLRVAPTDFADDFDGRIAIQQPADHINKVKRLGRFGVTFSDAVAQ
jgi:hypothetical protein